MKIFFGESIVSKELLEEAGNKNKIKLEYYKIINEDKINRKEKSKFGISVIKKEYIENAVPKFKYSKNELWNRILRGSYPEIYEKNVNDLQMFYSIL